MSTAYSYIRFSTPEQAAGDSLRRQLSATEAYCHQNGLVLSLKNFRDLGISGFKEKTQPSLSDMLTAIETGMIKPGDLVILENLDRLSRRGIDATLEVLRAILKAGVKIVSLQNGLELDGASLNSLEKTIMIAMHAHLAHEESKKKSERVRAAWQEKQRQAVISKLPKSVRVPAWLRVAPDYSSFELIEQKAAVVRRIFELSAKGVGRRSIAQTLNEEGVAPLTKGSGAREGKLWYPSTIAKLLGNGTAIGRFTPTKLANGRRVPDPANCIEDYYPPVVSSELYFQAKTHRERNQKAGGRKGKAFANLLQKFSICNSCRAPMVLTNKGVTTERYLRCSRSRIGACSHASSFNYPLLEHALVALLRIVDLSPMMPKDDIDITKTEKAAAESELSSVRERIAQLLEIDDIPQVLSAIRKLGDTQGQLEQRLRDLSLKLVVGSPNPAEQVSYWQQLSALISQDESGDLRAELNQFLKGLFQLTFDTTNRGYKSASLTLINAPFPVSLLYFEQTTNKVTAFSHDQEKVLTVTHDGGGIYQAQFEEGMETGFLVQ